jgi:hypothetical protein
MQAVHDVVEFVVVVRVVFRPAVVGDDADGVLRCMAVLAIANRLSANQALGDLVERVARMPKRRIKVGMLEL